MIVDITYPDYETRLAILKAKLQEMETTLEESILEQIALKVQKNIRELEGVLNKVVFYEQFKNQKIDSKKLNEIINEVSSLSSPKILVSDIINTVADFFEITPSDLTKRTRKKEVVEPRQIAMYLMREILKMSFPQIGEKFGKRDHTTAIHAYEKVSTMIIENNEINQKILMIKERLLNKG